MTEKRIINAEVNLKNYDKILESTFLMLMNQAMEEGKPTEHIPKIVIIHMKHLCRVCASTTPMMDEKAKKRYLTMLVQSFKDGLEDDFEIVEKVSKKVMARDGVINKIIQDIKDIEQKIFNGRFCDGKDD